MVSLRPPGGGGEGEWGCRVCIADFGHRVDLTPAGGEIGPGDPDGGTVAAFVGKEAHGATVDGPVRSMAPELLGWTESPSWSAASDLWGFGVSLWAALTRRQPYRNLGPVRHVRSHVLDGGRLPELTPTAESNAPPDAAGAMDVNIEIDEGRGWRRRPWGCRRRLAAK